MVTVRRALAVVTSLSGRRRGGRQDGVMGYSGSQTPIVRLGLFPHLGKGRRFPRCEPSPAGEVLLTGEQRADLGLVCTESSRATTPLNSP